MNTTFFNFSPSFILAFSFLIAVSLSAALIPLVLRFANTFGFVDGVDRVGESQRKCNTPPVPRLGGVAIVLSFLIALSFMPNKLPYQGVLLSSLLVFICGAIDDFTPLSPKLKIFIQIIASIIAVHADHLLVEQIVLTKQLSIPLPSTISYFISVFLIVGTINAINLVDGLDGLAAGIVLIGISLLAFANYVSTGSMGVIFTLALPIIGAIFGFLRYNTHPASIFMGDGGSNWLGFMSGAIILIALKSVDKNGHSFPFISVILAFAIPVIDTGAVICTRLLKGKNPFHADRNHFHHTLLRIGLTHGQSVMSIYFLAFTSGVLGIFPAIFPKYDFPWIPYAVALLIMFVIPASALLNDRLIASSIKSHQSFQRSPMSLWASEAVRYWENLNRYLLFGILLIGPALSGRIPGEFAFWAQAACLLIIGSSLVPPSKRGAVFFDSFAISTAAVLILTVNNLNPMRIEWEGTPYSIHDVYNILFVILFTSSLLLFIATARRRSLIFTPSDFLLLSFPLSILLLPKEWREHYKLDLISLRSLVIFMTMRVLYRRRPKHIGNLKIVCFAALVWIYLVANHGARIIY